MRTHGTRIDGLNSCARNSNLHLWEAWDSRERDAYFLRGGVCIGLYSSEP